MVLEQGKFSLEPSEFYFKGFKFEKIDFNLNKDFVRVHGALTKVSFDFSLSVDLPELNGVHMMEAQVSQSIVRLGVGVFKKFAQETEWRNEVPFTLDLVIAGEFSMASPTSVEKMERFSRINGSAALMPYVRTMISTITAGANVPPLLMPFVNTQFTFRKEEDADNDNREAGELRK